MGTLIELTMARPIVNAALRDWISQRAPITATSTLSDRTLVPIG